MNATSEATDTPVSSFASFGEEARQDPPGDARRSERAPDSFEACDALVDELIEDDRGRHFGALARLREDRQRRATTNVEETTGRGFYATARARLSDPAVGDARELRDASLSREPFEEASARVTLAERARARPASDDVGLVAPRASLFPNEEALSETAAEETAVRGPPQKILSAPASPFVPRRAADATPRGSPSPATPLDWSRTPPWTPRSAAKTTAAPVAGSNPRALGNAGSRAFARSLARRDNAPASPSSSPLSSPSGAAGVDPRGVRSIVPAASAHAHHSPTHHSTYVYGNGNGNAFVPARRANSLDLGVSSVASRGETRASETYGGGAYFFEAAPESAATARVFPMGVLEKTPASPGDFFAGAQGPGFERHREPANALYKTELCRSWEETGSCRYGGKCQFAHGRDELRPVMRHPKYKTEVCRTFAQSGACPYGTRCRFIHYRVPTRSVCGTLIAGAHNVIPTNWSPETASASARAASAGEGTSARRGALRAGADARGGGGVGVGDDARDFDGRASSPLDARRLPVFRDLAALSAGPAADSAANAGSRGGDAAEGRDFSAEPFPFAFVAERRASASAAASAVRRGGAAPPCASGGYDIGASVLFGNV
jgi:butyrate response factor 1